MTKKTENTLFWVSGRAVDSRQAEREFKSPCLCFFCFFFPPYCCTAVLLYTHGGFVGRWWMGFSAVLWCTAVHIKSLPSLFSTLKFLQTKVRKPCTAVVLRQLHVIICIVAVEVKWKVVIIPSGRQKYFQEPWVNGSGWIRYFLNNVDREENIIIAWLFSSLAVCGNDLATNVTLIITLEQLASCFAVLLWGVGFLFLKPRTNSLSTRSKSVVYPSAIPRLFVWYE